MLGQKTPIFIATRMALALCFTQIQAIAAPPGLEEAAAFPKMQVTGVAADPAGRLFVNFPLWSDQHSVSVAEVSGDGHLKPYPDDAWNAAEGDPGKRWVCVQSVYADGAGSLWVLDPASPKMEGVVPGGAKLVRIDLSSNQVARVYRFDDTVAPSKAYLNDVRIDHEHNHAYITESGTGALIVLNLQTAQARRVLANSRATRAEDDVKLVVDGMKLIDPKTGQTPQIHADGIALDVKQGLLYFHALTGRTLYRIKTEDLRNAALLDPDLDKRVEAVATTAACDGMINDGHGGVYLAAFEKNAIQHWDAESGKVATLIEDERLQWPDTFAWGAAGTLYVTTSQIHRQPKYHDGKSLQEGPFRVYRLRPPNQK